MKETGLNRLKIGDEYSIFLIQLFMFGTEPE